MEFDNVGHPFCNMIFFRKTEKHAETLEDRFEENPDGESKNSSVKPGVHMLDVVKVVNEFCPNAFDVGIRGQVELCDSGDSRPDEQPVTVKR